MHRVIICRAVCFFTSWCGKLGFKESPFLWCVVSIDGHCQDGLGHFFPRLPVWQRGGGGLKLFGKFSYKTNTFQKGASLRIEQCPTRLWEDLSLLKHQKGAQSKSCNAQLSCTFVSRLETAHKSTICSQRESARAPTGGGTYVAWLGEPARTSSGFPKKKSGANFV